MVYVTRFAPSPTGLLHLGNAYSALTGWQRARTRCGRFLLRIEDIDGPRCKPEFNAALLADLAWLGIDWDGPVWRQSDRAEAHATALAELKALGLVYPCFCSRADLAAAASAPHGAGVAYSGTCRQLSAAERAARAATVAPAWRLDVVAALARTGPLTFSASDGASHPADPAPDGDPIIGRRDIGVAYHLAVVVDDAAQGVTEVVRGADLLPATPVQRLLQALLGLPAPVYHHHPLLGIDGRRLAKRDSGLTLAALRAAGSDPVELRSRLLGPATLWPLGAAPLDPHLS